MQRKKKFRAWGFGFSGFWFRVQGFESKGWGFGSCPARLEVQE